MKNLLKSALIAGCVLLMGGIAQAQTKVGHTNFSLLVSGDPAFKGVQAQITAYQNDFIAQQKGLQDELQTKGADYEAKKKDMTDAVRMKAEGELNDLNKRLQDFNQDAQNKITAKSQDYYKPLVDKYKAAVAQVAKEKGYNYIIDTSSTELLVASDADDITAAVKAKVGTSAPAAAAPGARGPVKK